MKKIFKKLAGLIVTLYANRIYAAVAKQADAAHQKTKERYYVISSMADISKLVIIDRNGFREMKNATGAHTQTLANLMKGAWYYTADKLERGGLSASEREVRRLAFARHMLERAKLL